jgi:hypothetical protein
MESPEAAALVAQEYGTTADVTAEGRPVKAILVTSTMGIEQGSGRIFQGHDANTLAWRSDTVVQEVMNLAPEDDSARSQSTNRYQRMSWVGRALAQVRDVGAETPKLDMTSDVSKQDIRDEDKARRAETTLASKPAEESTKAQTVTVSTPLRKRARLSRSAGITNVLAVAARLGKPGSASTESFILARNEISAWLRKKPGTPFVFTKELKLGALWRILVVWFGGRLLTGVLVNQADSDASLALLFFAGAAVVIAAALIVGLRFGWQSADIKLANGVVAAT